MKLVRLADQPAVDLLYHRILLPSFPPAELVTLASLRNEMLTGAGEAFAALGDEGAMLGGAVGSWYPSSRVMLLSYLAVAPGERSGGVGGFLCSQVVRQWQERYQPCVILAEVERPDRHTGNVAHGDPGARLRFYGRQGARALDLPYFQPALGRQGSRVYGMLLLLLYASRDFLGDEGAQTLAAEPLREFLTRYLDEAEGAVAQDPQTGALWQRLDTGNGVRLLPVDQFRRIPAAIA